MAFCVKVDEVVLVEADACRRELFLVAGAEEDAEAWPEDSA